MAIIRGPRPADNFAQVHNAAIEDGRMTAKARGVLVYLLSRPPGWSTSSERLAASDAFQRDGRDAIRAALRELEQFGYLTRTRTNLPDGKWSHDQTVTDQPTMDGLSGDGKTADGSAADGKPVDINKTDSNNTDSSVLTSSSPSPSVTEDVVIPVSTSPVLSREENKRLFEIWWGVYPNSQKHAETERLYAAAVKSGISHEVLLEAARGYIRRIKQQQIQPQYIASSVTWLKDERWQDKYPPAPKPPSALHPLQRSVAE